MNPVSITTRKRPTEAYMFEELFEHGMGTIYLSRLERACGPEQYHFTIVSDVPPGS